MEKENQKDEKINQIHEFVDRVVKECKLVHPQTYNVPYVCESCLARVMIRELTSIMVIDRSNKL